MIIKIATVNEKKYKVVKLLGKGKGGYSYLAVDKNQHYVLKQIHHEKCDYYNFGNKIESEIKDYQQLAEIGIKLPKMHDVDLKHERILKEYIDGETIYDLICQNKMKAEYMNQVHDMCSLLYTANINIDYFPTNFVVQNDEVFYIDYECNAYMDEWNFENWGIKYWSMTPEFIKYMEEHS